MSCKFIISLVGLPAASGKPTPVRVPPASSFCTTKVGVNLFGIPNLERTPFWTPFIFLEKSVSPISPLAADFILSKVGVVRRVNLGKSVP